MKKLLVAVDGSDCSGRAVAWAIDTVQAMKSPSEIHLVTVQSAFSWGEVRRFVSAEAIEGHQREEGDKALAAGRAQLAQANVPFVAHILVGQLAHSIVDFAAQNDCAIVMGTRGLGGVSEMILGSVASQVIHLSTVPVTLVK
ncbi:MAG: universal stress protein [Proteobacteria bacterium]|nr:universal stress protein [Burkholderiales bacterium]